MAINRNFFVYEVGVNNVAGFKAGSALIGGSFVSMNTVDWTVVTTGQSASTPVIGVVSNDCASGSTENEVVTAGYVRMRTQVAMAAGDKAYPSSVKGRIIKTGLKLSGATTPVFSQGFGLVVAGASASGYAIVKLKGLV